MAKFQHTRSYTLVLILFVVVWIMSPKELWLSVSCDIRSLHSCHNLDKEYEHLLLPGIKIFIILSWSFDMAEASNLRKFLHANCVFHQFVKVFSLESFPHYGIGWYKLGLLSEMIDRRENEGNVHSKCGRQVWFTTRPRPCRSSSSRWLLPLVSSFKMRWHDQCTKGSTERVVPRMSHPKWANV